MTPLNTPSIVALLLVAILCWPSTAYQDHSGDELYAWVAAVRSHTAGQEDVFTEDIQRWPAAKWDRMALSIRDFVNRDWFLR